MVTEFKQELETQRYRDHEGNAFFLCVLRASVFQSGAGLLTHLDRYGRDQSSYGRPVLSKDARFYRYQPSHREIGAVECPQVYLWGSLLSVLEKWSAPPA